MTGDEFETVRAFSETLTKLTHEQFIFVSKLVSVEAEKRAEMLKKPSRVKLFLVPNDVESNNNDGQTE